MSRLNRITVGTLLSFEFASYVILIQQQQSLLSQDDGGLGIIRPLRSPSQPSIRFRNGTSAVWPRQPLGAAAVPAVPQTEFDAAAQPAASQQDAVAAEWQRRVAPEPGRAAAAEQPSEGQPSAASTPQHGTPEAEKPLAVTAQQGTPDAEQLLEVTP